MTKRLVVHHDDLGSSHSANLAFVELSQIGVVTCGSVMVPAPWFSEVVSLAHQMPELDIGVHLTLASEFPHYRWRPLTSGTTLRDDLGYFWGDNERARCADTGEVYQELKAQVQCAIDAGIDVTHLDAHMGTAWQPEFIEVYVALGEEFDVPILLSKDVQRLSAPHRNLDIVFERLRSRHNPEFARFLTTPFGNLNPTDADYREILGRSGEGLNWCGFHFATPGDIESISPDAATRIAEYQLFYSQTGTWLRDKSGFELVGMRALRAVMRA